MYYLLWNLDVKMNAKLIIGIVIGAQLAAYVHPLPAKGFGYMPTDILISPPVHNRRGFIGGGNVCPKNGNAIGLRLKMHNYVRNEFSNMQPGPSEVSNNNEVFLSSSSVGNLDNTALNGVRLRCSRSDKEIKSAEGDDGIWTDFINCQGNGDYITGFRIKSERWMGWGRLQ